MIKYQVTIPAWALFTWQSQAEQYSRLGEPGISHEKHDVGTFGDPCVVHCLLWRDDEGKLRGILCYYEHDCWEVDGTRLQKPGDVNMWVQPGHQRQGIGTALMKDAMAHWPIDFGQQDYTELGAAFAEHFESLRIVEALSDGNHRSNTETGETP